MSRVVVCIVVLTILIGPDGPAFAGKESGLQVFVDQFGHLARHCYFEDHVFHRSREKNIRCHPVIWWQHNYGSKKQLPD
jgi:hypothetical protein